MIDYQRIAEDIRTAVACNGREARTLLAESAADYAAAAEEINSRLRQCAELLKKGLRSEALQLCEREPNLLDIVGTLDLPELAEWQATLNKYRIANPSALLIEVAADLNEAYALEQPLAESLRVHRLQSLGRVPLELRIKTIRRLAKLDSDNPVWQDDQRSYERARLQQIPAEADSAFRERNVESLQALFTELRDSQWLECVPPTFLAGVQHAEQKLCRADARQHMERLEPQLNQAFAEYDEEQGMELRQQWDHFIGQAPLRPESKLLERALPALRWLDQVREQRQLGWDTTRAQEVLEQALDQPLGLHEFERLHHAAVRLQQMPELLERRYQTRIESLELQQSRRRRFVVGAASVTIVLAASLTAWGIYTRNADAEIERHVATFQSLVNIDHLAEAEKYAAELRANAPHVASSAAMIDLTLQLDRLKATERGRLSHFADALEAATKAGVTHPDKAALAEAMQAARTDSEKLAVADFEVQVKTEQRRLQQERDQQFSARVGILADQLKVIESSSLQEPDTLLGKLDSIEREVKNVLQGSAMVSQSVISSGQALRIRIDHLQIEALQRNRELAALPAITAATGNLTDFQTALETYVKVFSDSKRAADFKSFVADGLPLYRAMEDWSKFAQDWRKAHQTPIHAETARELSEQLKQLERKQSNFPWASGIHARAEYIEAIIAQDDISSITDLKKLLADRLISNMWMIQAGDERYYSTKRLQIKSQPEVIKVEYIAAFDGSKKEKPFRKSDFREGGPNWYGPAPQSVVATNALDALAKIGQEPWELVFLSICHTIQTQERIEPIVQLILLEQVLNVGTKGSRILSELCKAPMNLLKTSPVDLTTVWLDPTNDDAKPQRSLAANLMRKMPSFKEMVPHTQQRLTALTEIPSLDPIYVGWLVQSDEGWRALSDTTSRGAGSVYALTQTVESGAVEMTKFGEIGADGKIKLGALRVQREGQLLFAIKSPQNTGSASGSH